MPDCSGLCQCHHLLHLPCRWELARSFHKFSPVPTIQRGPPASRLSRTCRRLCKPVLAGFERGLRIFAFFFLFDTMFPTEDSVNLLYHIYCSTFSGITIPKLLKHMMTSKNNTGKSLLSWLLAFHRALAIKRF